MPQKGAVSGGLSSSVSVYAKNPAGPGGGAPGAQKATMEERRPPKVYISWDARDKGFKMDVATNVKIGDNVTVVIKGKITGVSKRQDPDGEGGSVDVEMALVKVRNDENKEFNDMMKDA